MVSIPQYHKQCKLCEGVFDIRQFDITGSALVSICIACEKTLAPVTEGMKRCYTCLTPKNPSEFSLNYGKPRSTCKECYNKNRKKETYEEIRDRNLRMNYGLSLEDYNIMLFQQGYVCAVCKLPETVIDGYTQQPKSLSVDHDHTSGKVRQLLCTTCNQLLGHLEQDPRRVKLLMAYLKKHTRS